MLPIVPMVPGRRGAGPADPWPLEESLGCAPWDSLAIDWGVAMRDGGGRPRDEGELSSPGEVLEKWKKSTPRSGLGEGWGKGKGKGTGEGQSRGWG